MVTLIGASRGIHIPPVTPLGTGSSGGHQACAPGWHAAAMMPPGDADSCCPHPWSAWFLRSAASFLAALALAAMSASPSAASASGVAAAPFSTTTDPKAILSGPAPKVPVSGTSAAAAAPAPPTATDPKAILSGPAPKVPVSGTSTGTAPPADTSAPRPAGPDPLHLLAASERAFASLAKTAGIRGSFLAYFAPDGIIFRPRPMRARDWYTSRPPSKAALSWYPAYARVSADGGLGFTTGPSELRVNGPDDPEVNHGTFVSLWRVEPDGSWKVALDAGIGNPAPSAPIAEFEPPLPSPPAPIRILARPEQATERAKLLEMDKTFCAGAERPIVDRLGFYADDARVMRDGHPVAVGLAEARALLTAERATAAQARADKAAAAGTGAGAATGSATAPAANSGAGASVGSSSVPPAGSGTGPATGSATTPGATTTTSAAPASQTAAATRPDKGQRSKLISCETSGSEISAAGDLGATYGSYVPPGSTDRGYFLRIWSRAGGRGTWKIAVDLTMPPAAP